MAGSFLVTVEAEVNSREVSEVVVVLVTVTSVLEEEWAVAMLEAAETFEKEAQGESESRKKAQEEF